MINFLQHDERFEGFCEALEANDQHGVLMRHLQKHLVCAVIELSNTLYYA